MQKTPRVGSVTDVTAVARAAENMSISDKPAGRKPEAIPADVTMSPLGGSTSGQIHENDLAQVVLVCEPDLNNNLMGSIHPHGALYEKPVNLQNSQDQHALFRQCLRDHGVHCLTVHQIMKHECETNLKARDDLETLAAGRLTYKLDPSVNEADVHIDDLYYVGDAYKRQVLETMSLDHLIDMVLCKPTVLLKPSLRDTGFTATYTFEPLTNLQYTRDQQITTARGIVMGRLRSAQRQHEVELMEFCLKKLGLEVVANVREPGFLEGGDFFPAGRGLCMIGVGLRSNIEAVQQLMTENVFGTERVAVVRDDFEQNQDRMHLDCIFNIIGSNVVVLAEDVMGEQSAVRRVVDEYSINRTDSIDQAGAHYGVYQQSRSGVEFSQYLEENGFHVIPITRQEQLEYGCNVLNLGNGNILACHREASRKIVQSPHFKGKLQLLEFGSITAMYGGLHCSSQVVRRLEDA